MLPYRMSIEILVENTSLKTLQKSWFRRRDLDVCWPFYYSFLQQTFFFFKRKNAEGGNTPTKAWTPLTAYTIFRLFSFALFHQVRRPRRHTLAPPALALPPPLLLFHRPRWAPPRRNLMITYRTELIRAKKRWTGGREETIKVSSPLLSYYLNCPSDRRYTAILEQLLIVFQLKFARPWCDFKANKRPNTNQ
jgi:hypothetical protein